MKKTIEQLRAEYEARKSREDVYVYGVYDAGEGDEISTMLIKGHGRPAGKDARRYTALPVLPQDNGYNFSIGTAYCVNHAFGRHVSRNKPSELMLGCRGIGGY